jgi:hypothetical protein
MKQRIQGFVAALLLMATFAVFAAASTRIGYSLSSPGGSHASLGVHYTILAQQEVNRAVAIAAAVTAFGATPANLEGSAEFNVPAGQGATYYSALTTLQTNLNTVTSSQLANLDGGS